jgi:hypothetical protein
VRQALRLFEESDALAREYVQRDPDDTEWLREHLRCRIHVANLPLWEGVQDGAPRPPGGAPRAFQVRRAEDEAHEFEDLARQARGNLKRNPDSAEWCCDLGTLQTELGRIYLWLADNDPGRAVEWRGKAERSLDAADALWAELTGRDPNNPDWAAHRDAARQLREQLRAAKAG